MNSTCRTPASIYGVALLFVSLESTGAHHCSLSGSFTFIYTRAMKQDHTLRYRSKSHRMITLLSSMSSSPE